MKHTPSVTAILVTIFIVTQVFGLYTISHDLAVLKDPTTGQLILDHPDTAIGERPDIQNWSAVIYISIAIAVGTFLVMVIVRFKGVRLWKLWFFLAVWLTISITIGVFVRRELAYTIAFILAAVKIFRHNSITHNVTEILMYTGIAVLLVPLLKSPLWAFVLLLVISAYDIIAVWKSKHMVKMAKFQTKTKLFAGLLVPYKEEKKEPTVPKPEDFAGETELEREAKAVTQISVSSKAERKSAILGGGDIAFPLLFAGSIMEWLIQDGVSKSIAFYMALIIGLTSAGALLWLFILAKKDKFYPAMPFITGGCIVGAVIILLIKFWV